MSTMPVSSRVSSFFNVTNTVMQFLLDSDYQRRPPGAQICDFVLGNPQEMPLSGFVQALQDKITPRNKDWYAYKFNEPDTTSEISADLRQWRGIPFERDDIFVTNGAFGALAVCMHALLDPGDEVIFNSPPWFFYESLIVAVGGVPVRVRIRMDDFDLDLDAIERAITPRTKAIIVNSPHNPTGKIYSAETLRALADVLTRASQRIGHPVVVISDEAYSKIIFDNTPFHSMTEFYPHTLLVYTYGKTLLTPGQRIGYIALTPTMPEREMMRAAILSGQIMTGFSVANALLQHSIADLNKLSIDVPHLQAKRDRVVGGLREIGYEVTNPQGTFYSMAKSPLDDDQAFVKVLAANNVYVLPGTIVEMPGWFRISLTANDSMIERGLPGFEAAWNQVRG